jgi:aspartokinase-like uncharacterized kinase
MIEPGLRVVKVGGSLFDFDPLVPILRRLIAAQPTRATVLFAGGGVFADAIRAADSRYGLGEEISHRLCGEVLRVTARLLAALLPELPLETRLDDLRRRLATSPGCTAVFCPAAFLQQDAAGDRETRLPLAWSVTSDSIAARLAERLGADELVLLKSSNPPEEWTSANGFVDAHFAIASRMIPLVRVDNLRAYVATG